MGEEPTRTRFELDEEAARDWLAAGVSADFMDHMAADNTLPELDGDWNPATDRDGSRAEHLVHDAQVRGVITHPPHITVALDLTAGADPGYRFLVMIDPDPGQSLILATALADLALLGEEGKFGAEAGSEMLRDAVDSANECLDDLGRHMASRAPTPDLNDPEQLAAALANADVVTKGVSYLRLARNIIAGRGEDGQ
jgi:hypothetical protein